MLTPMAMAKESVQSFLKEIMEVRSNLLPLKSSISMDLKSKSLFDGYSSFMNVLNENYETIKVVHDQISIYIKNIQETDRLDIFYEAAWFKVLDLLPYFDEIRNLISTMIAQSSEGTIDLESKNDLEGLFRNLLQCLKSLLDIKDIREGIIIAKISEVNVQSEGYRALGKYIETAKSFNLEDGGIIKGILAVIDGISGSGRSGHQQCLAPEPYAAIIGPSFMGKTQFAFTLARIRPVFYVNFAFDQQLLQDIYVPFVSITQVFLECLQADLATFDGIKNSDNLAGMRNSQFKALGLLLELTQYSKTFDPSTADWFPFYLKGKRLVVNSISLNEMCEILGNDEEFRIPIVYIDELNENYIKEIKLLRNLCRFIVLPCVLSSTNSNISNMLNLKTSSSQNMNTIWVYGIKRLPKTELEATFKNLGLEGVIQNGRLDSKLLLNHFQLKFDTPSGDESFSRLLDLLMAQSKTSLQGVGRFGFECLVNYLERQQQERDGGGLALINVGELWKSVCYSLHESFWKRKSAAFTDEGRFFSLKMFSNTLVMSQIRDSSQICINAPDIRNSVDRHFFRFGQISEPDILPLQYFEETLFLKGQAGEYSISSHCLPFSEDLLTLISLWAPTKKQASVAQIVSRHVQKIIGVSANSNALSNDYRAQECMSYWSAADSSHYSVEGRNSGSEFVSKVISNGQLRPVVRPTEEDRTRIGTSLSLSTMILFPVSSICKNLNQFLKDVRVPYLIPDIIPPTTKRMIKTDGLSIKEKFGLSLESEQYIADIQGQLEGFMDVGLCYRCRNGERIDIGFELFYKNERSLGYIECKYKDKPESMDNIFKYISRSQEKESRLTIYYTHSLNSQVIKDISDRFLRDSAVHASCDVYSEKDDDSSDEDVYESKSKRPKSSGFKISVYSVFYDTENILKMIPLLEYEDPDSVFIIIETNFIKT